jgi:hypothetical protein
MFVTKPICLSRSVRLGQLRFPALALMLLLGSLYPLVSGQESAVSPEQLVGRLPEVTGEELAARFGMSDRGTAVAGPTSHLLLTDLSAFAQRGQLAAEGTPHGK